MYVHVKIVCMVLLCVAAPIVLGQNVTNSSCAGFGYEIITSKLDYLQFKLIEMDYTIKEDRETFEQKLSHQETLSDGLLWAIHQLTQAIGHNLTTIQTTSHKLLSQQTACANHEKMRQEIEKLAPKVEQTKLKIDLDVQSTKSLSHSCKELASKESGEFLIQLSEFQEPFVGYCDQTAFGGGWLVIQHRFNGSLDFDRSWSDYRDGFGSVDGEFWLGLERLHRLTSARSHWLLVELKDFTGNYSFALYNQFEIGSETEQYSLKNLGSYTGTAGDSLTYHKGMNFTTKDRDNDRLAGGNCASGAAGGWWFNQCNYANPNGLYSKTLTNRIALSWYHYKGNTQALAYSRMLIREN